MDDAWKQSVTSNAIQNHLGGLKGRKSCPTIILEVPLSVCLHHSTISSVL